jgi:Protein of unknown function (DUF2442)
MYYDEDGHPHFHARHAGGQAKVRVDKGRGHREQPPCSLHRVELLENWQRARGGCQTAGHRAASMTGLTPDITSVSVVRDGVLQLTFADGVSGQLDVLDRMRGPVFEEATTPAGFATVAVDDESGTIVWPGGADLAPDTLYERVRTGLWPGENAAA